MTDAESDAVEVQSGVSNVNASVAHSTAMLRLLQISSPTLPVGSFAYSNGLEGLVESGQITDEQSLLSYLSTLVCGALGLLDLPRLLRMHRAFLVCDLAEAERQSAWLYASRESFEFQAQERQTAQAFCKILVALGTTKTPPLFGANWQPKTYAEAYALAAVAFEIEEHTCLLGYALVWAESHTCAAAKLLSLGPLSVQRVLSAILKQLAAVVDSAYRVVESDIGCAAPGLGIASARHETQYCRLFRS